VQTDRISLEVRTEVIHRLRRAAGQLQAVARTLEAGGDCEAVLRQLTAGKNAVERAGIKLLSAGLLECLAAPEDDDLVPERFEKLFMELA
jgi:DNA-binding FrmR family transcriptional regulator